MRFPYITIEREYGSGGTRIARELAERCGISCYGEEIPAVVSKKTGVSVEQIQQFEESVSNSFLYTIFMLSRAQAGNADMLTAEGQLFVAEQQVIRELAVSGPAVFVGHCASEALKDREVIKVFIGCSDNQAKRMRIVEDYGIASKQAESVRARFDNKRARYYYANTARKWDDPKNYDIVLDSARLGIEGCVALLGGLLNVE